MSRLLKSLRSSPAADLRRLHRPVADLVGWAILLPLFTGLLSVSCLLPAFSALLHLMPAPIGFLVLLLSLRISSSHDHSRVEARISATSSWIAAPRGICSINHNVPPVDNSFLSYHVGQGYSSIPESQACGSIRRGQIGGRRALRRLGEAGRMGKPDYGRQALKWGSRVTDFAVFAASRDT